MPPPDPNVDELRRQLRALGYLDAGVNRFVLGPARDTRRPVAIALLASLRVGVIAALLLGPAAAIGLGGRLPGLVTGPRDAVVIALYMGALFGAAVSFVAFAASVVVASIAGERVARRARTLSRAAGAIVTIACLAYLTLWWRTANAGFGWSAPVWTLFALAVAAAISLLLGHVVRVTAFAVIVAGRGGAVDTLTPASGRFRSWKMSLAGGVLAFLGAAVLLVVTAPKASTAEPGSGGLTVVSSGTRVRLIAIDGVDPGVLDDLAHAGRIPSLAAALSTARARLAADDTRDPARSWTTIATGQPAEVHGVRGLETRRVAGLQGSVSSGEPSRLVGAIRAATDLLRLTRPAIASGTERRAKTIWEVASDAGLRTVVVNWWATWPAAGEAAGAGIILSDRATLRLEKGGALDAEIAPSSLYQRLIQRWPGLRQEAVNRATRALAAAPPADATVRAVLQRSAELDTMQMLLAKEVSSPAPDLLAVYLPGLDIAQHVLLGPGDGAMAASTVAARLEALRGYYVFLDRMLADGLTPAPDELVAVVTEPGRVSAATDGIIAITGRHARPQASGSGRPVDVMPTILHALGVPISRDLAGAPLTPLFADEFLQRYPIRQVATYGRPSSRLADRQGRPLDQEMIDRLRSLGYVR